MSAVIDQTITVTNTENVSKNFTYGLIISSDWRSKDGLVNVRVSFWEDEASFNANDKAQTRTWVYVSTEYPTLLELEAQIEANQALILS